MKFIADVMLGSLAKAMRFCGYDVIYDNKADDESLKEQSRHGMLLTKDRLLAAELPSGRVYLVQATGAQRQLEEIQSHFPIKKTAPRCMECNGRLAKIQKSKVRHLVPPFVWNQQKQFYRCIECFRVYWTGTHYQNMLRMLK